MKALLLTLCASTLIFADSSRYREDFHYSYPQTSGGRLALENFNGSVEISGWDQNTVDVSGTKYAETQQLLHEIKIEASSSGNMVHLKTVHPDRNHGNMGAKYIIRVPRRTELGDIASSNGSIRIEDIEGNCHLTTSNGGVHLAKVRGSIDGHTSNGGVELTDVLGSVAFRTSNGSINAGNVEGAFEASTSNGGIHAHLRDTQGGLPIKLSTSNGGIDLQLDSPRQNEVIASTSNGSITVRLPGTLNASVHASTNSGGSVRSDFDILMRGEISKHRIEGTIGGGGPTIDLSTSNGNIHLVKI
jgi:Putative adhesin